MIDYEVLILGDLTLKQTEDVCKAEQLGGFQLINITSGNGNFENGTVRLINKADFIMKNSSSILTRLEFIELGNSNEDTLKKEMSDKGWTFIDNPNIYVKGFLRKVLVFGKK